MNTAIITTRTIVKPMIWVTAQGERIPITKMETTHLFNAMKMVFNHLAEAHGGMPVWFVRQYGDVARAAEIAPHVMAEMCAKMLAELDRRNDLPENYCLPLEQIRGQITNRRLNK